MALVQIQWSPRTVPLEPGAVAATGGASLALARRVLALPPERFGQLRAVAGRGLIIVLGEAGLLPWVPGVSYLGRDADAPGLLLSTNLKPSVPSLLLERALLAEAAHGAPAAGHRPPLAVLAGSSSIAWVGSARPIEPAALAEWIALARIESSGIEPSGHEFPPAESQEQQSQQS